MPDISLRFDLRVPPFAATTYAAQHQAALDMCEWGEQIGAGAVLLSEHHGDPAGFTSAPLTVAAAVLARTRRIKVVVSAALVPLHDPVRLAEQLATLACLAPGRLEVVLGAGYRKAEFTMAGVARGDRGKLVEECYAVCRQAFTGQPFSWRGRDVLVTPVPPPDGVPHLMIGGKTDIAARRAARLDAPFSPAKADPDLLQCYVDECARLGHVPRIEGLGAKPMGPGFVMISHDPEATWALVEPAARYDAATYASWQDDTARSDWFVSGAGEMGDLRESGNYVVFTPEQCIAQYRRHGSLMLHPLMGGIAPDLAWQSLRLFEAEVLPAIS